MIEYMNNPALLILSLEIIGFLLFVNVCLLFALKRKNNKAVKALNALIKDIKEKGEDNKKKMAEIILQPGLTDPEAIKKGLQGLVEGQNQLFKDMIKAIRTQSLDDITPLGDSVSGLINSAMVLGRESGEGLVDTEAQERLEKENESLSEEKENLETKLKSTSEEMDVLMSEYTNMMTNADESDSSDNSAESETSEEAESAEVSNVDESEVEEEGDVVDISEDDASTNEEAESDDIADELMNEILGDEEASDSSEEKSEEQAA